MMYPWAETIDAFGYSALLTRGEIPSHNWQITNRLQLSNRKRHLDVPCSDGSTTIFGSCVLGFVCDSSFEYCGLPRSQRAGSLNARSSRRSSMTGFLTGYYSPVVSPRDGRVRAERRCNDCWEVRIAARSGSEEPRPSIAQRMLLLCHESWWLTAKRQATSGDSHSQE